MTNPTSIGFLGLCHMRAFMAERLLAPRKMLAKIQEQLHFGRRCCRQANLQEEHSPLVTHLRFTARCVLCDPSLVGNAVCVPVFNGFGLG